MKNLTLKLLPVLLAGFGLGQATAEVPRTADGHPDLSGTYNVATLTPLERPDRYQGKATLTDKEAQAVAENSRANLARDQQQSDPNRGAPAEGGTKFYIPEIEPAAGGVGGYNAFFVDLGDSNFKIDGKWRTSIIVDPPDGKLPPITDLGKARTMSSQVAIQKNTGKAWWIDMEVGPYDHPEMRPVGERCLLGFGSTAGPPALPVMYNNLKRIVQTEDYVMILIEMNHDARIVRMNAEHEPSHIRKWLGDSVGHWDGDTLVVDTTNFREQSGFSMASEDLHVVERFSRVDEDTLLYRFTVEDPTWTAPWSGEYPWPASDHKVYEYACHEGNYALGGILRGARVLEEDVLAERASAGGG